MIGRLLCMVGRHRWERFRIVAGRHVEMCTRPACRGFTDAWRWGR